MKQKNYTYPLFILLFTTQALALELPVSRAIIFYELPYTAGVHEGRARSIESTISVDPETRTFQSATFVVPISEIKSDNVKRDCHTRESLGLDYGRSRYPEDHVCSSDQTLPQEGPDSIAFPKIQLKVDTVVDGNGQPYVLVEGDSNVTAQGMFSMHGVEKRIEIPLVINYSQAENKLKIHGDFKVSLSEYGVVVKPVLIIKVKDRARVIVDLESILPQT